MRINARSAFVVCREVVAHMLEHGGGSIVITSSIGGEKGFGLESVYCMTKGAVLQLARSIAVEYRDPGASAPTPSALPSSRPTTGCARSRNSTGWARIGTTPICMPCRAASANPRRWRRPLCFSPPTRPASSTDWALYVDNGWYAKG